MMTAVRQRENEKWHGTPAVFGLTQRKHEWTEHLLCGKPPCSVCRETQLSGTQYGEHQWAVSITFVSTFACCLGSGSVVFSFMTGTESENIYSWHCSEKSLRRKSAVKNPNRTNQFSSEEGVKVCACVHAINQPKSGEKEQRRGSVKTAAVQAQPPPEQLHLNYDLWETSGGRIRFCSEQNLNKVTVQDHKTRIYWVHLDMCETAAAECLRWHADKMYAADTWPKERAGKSVGPNIIHDVNSRLLHSPEEQKKIRGLRPRVDWLDSVRVRFNCACWEDCNETDSVRQVAILTQASVKVDEVNWGRETGGEEGDDGSHPAVKPWKSSHVQRWTAGVGGSVERWPWKIYMNFFYKCISSLKMEVGQKP